MRNWLARSPCRYARIPYLGIRKYTLQIRIKSPAVLVRNVNDVLPRPFNILINAVLVYRNGQIKASVIMKLPASLLWKIRFPIIFPRTKNPAMQRKPREKQQKTTFRINLGRLSRKSETWSSATVGRSMVETEFVIADGNRMQGSAIPVRTPYVLKESDKVSPYI